MKTKSTTNLSGRGLAAGYWAGRKHVEKLNEDRKRYDFMSRLLNAWCYDGLNLTASEGQFVAQFFADVDEDAPKIRPVTASTCDNLRTKYEERLAINDFPKHGTPSEQI